MKRRVRTIRDLASGSRYALSWTSPADTTTLSPVRCSTRASYGGGACGVSCSGCSTNGGRRRVRCGCGCMCRSSSSRVRGGGSRTGRSAGGRCASASAGVERRTGNGVGGLGLGRVAVDVDGKTWVAVGVSAGEFD